MTENICAAAEKRGTAIDQNAWGDWKISMQSLNSAELPPHDRAIDITAETCPMTFVRTRLALDSLAPGAVLLVRLTGADPRANVPRAAADQGHDLLDLIELDDGSAILVIRKGIG